MTGSDLLAALTHRFSSRRVICDFAGRTAYAIDASIYKVVPKAVVLVEQESDLAAALDAARRHGVPITARSGGTNLTGNAVGSGIILEFSGLDRLLELNSAEKWVRLQPGMTLAELNRRIRSAGLMFGPDPSSGEMCKIGGMLGNNAAGPHTLRYGATKDNVIQVRVVTASGRILNARRYPLKSPELAHLITEHPEVDRLIDLIRRNQSLITSRRRHVSKNSSGYNLFDLSDGLSAGFLDLHKLFVGSEGTLGLTAEATLRLVERPPQTIAGLIFLRRRDQIGPAVNALLPFTPSALELLDENSLDLVGRDRYGVPPDARAMLLIEFDREPLDERIRQVSQASTPFDLSEPIRVARSEEEQESFWKIRKAIYPTLYRFDDRKKPINFADDVVVPARHLPDMIEFLEGLFAREGIPVAIYGHIGDGNAHINPLMDLSRDGEIDRMVRISKEIHSTVIARFEGSVCGEHGDGRLRAPFLRELYGNEIYDLFVAVKRLFDPDGVLNPGIKISETPISENVDADRLAKGCATCGKCNTVCPVYDVTKEESNSARGWFHVLTAADYTYDRAERVVEACMNCKSCAVVCPAGIDVSAVALARRAERPNRLAGLVFRFQEWTGPFEGILRLLARTQPLWDRPIPRRILAGLSRPILRFLSPQARFPAEMILPRLATHTLRKRHHNLTEEAGRQGQVAYFHGCAANYLDDGVGDAVIRLLARRGVEFVLPRQRCSGTPIETYGHREIASRSARFNLESLDRFETIVTGCASCTYALKDYGRLATTEEESASAARLARRVRHITEFLVENKEVEGIAQGGEVGGRRGPVVVYHASCHLRAAGVTKPPKELLARLPDIQFKEMKDSDRCAGGAGTFIVKNYAQSQQIFERKRNAIEEAGAEVVATSCPACMVQLKNGLGGRLPVKHVAQILDEAERRY